MNNNAWIIWNELAKNDYKIHHMIINVNYIQNNIYRNSLEIKIIFENYDLVEKFSNFVFKQYGIDIHVNTWDNSFEIELKNKNISYVPNSIMENLTFPPNTENIEIIEYCAFDTEISTIKLFNLPENLLQLKISSSNILFDLSNIPSKLFLLDISGCANKLNLDYLPEGLKILYLPDLPYIKQNDFNYSYNLSDLSNLPNSLIEIIAGYLNFKSTKDLMKTFDEKICHEIKLKFNNSYKCSL